MKVTGWTSYYDSKPNGGQYEELLCSRNEWEDIIDTVVLEIRSRGYRFTGDYHQDGDFGAPIIDDKYVVQVSKRTWGGIMVYAYPEEFEKPNFYNYTYWAWWNDEQQIIPNQEDYKR